MPSPAASGATISGAKRPCGRPSKPEAEKKQARMWRCTLWSCTAGDREKLILCGADEEKTKRFAMRDSEGKFEALFSFNGPAKRADKAT